MRYRRLSYRYALLVTANQSNQLSGLLEAEQSGVRFAQTYWRPPADVCESDSTIEVTVDLAGIDQDDLDVVLFEDALIVEGRRRLTGVEPGVVYHVAEIRQGRSASSWGCRGPSTRSVSMRATTRACCALPFRRCRRRRDE
jgi:HSP20 family protein